MANRRNFPRAVRRRSNWEGAQISISLTTAVQAQQAVVTEAILENVPNPTIVRIRGKLATSSAFAAGGASVESPFTEIGGDWIWWQSVTMRDSDAAAAANNDNTGRLVRVVVDSKAMRKISPNLVLIFVAHNVVSGSTMTIVVGGVIRVLLKT